jgi:hypothetical protein
MIHRIDLFTTALTQILGKLNDHKMYVHIHHQDGSSSNEEGFGSQSCWDFTEGTQTREVTYVKH